MKTRIAILAATAGVLFVAGSAGLALAESHSGHEAKIKCEGVNECKGQSSCKTLFSSCAGQNGCSGKGFVMLSPEECEAAKAEMGKEG